MRPVFERLKTDGVIRGWGLTGVGHPRALIDVLSEQPRPDAVQCVANALDLTGDIWAFAGDRPDNAGVRARAVEAGVPVIGIRAVAAGSLTDALDRPVAVDDPAARDFAAAAEFRRLAADRGESAALLAHRYALTMPELATVVLGVKNRAEPADCLAAEAAGPLSPDEMARLRPCDRSAERFSASRRCCAASAIDSALPDLRQGAPGHRHRRRERLGDLVCVRGHHRRGARA